MGCVGCVGLSLRYILTGAGNKAGGLGGHLGLGAPGLQGDQGEPHGPAEAPSLATHVAPLEGPRSCSCRGCPAALRNLLLPLHGPSAPDTIRYGWSSFVREASGSQELTPTVGCPCGRVGVPRHKLQSCLRLDGRMAPPAAMWGPQARGAGLWPL